jgi:hypothetical protein
MKNITAFNGVEAMEIDCVNYIVEIQKSINSDWYGESIKYTEKKSGTSICIFSSFNINWDEEKDGGKLEIKYRDRWGSEMIFIHYPPSDLKGIFDFIGRGYDVFKNGFACND